MDKRYNKEGSSEEGDSGGCMSYSSQTFYSTWIFVSVTEVFYLIYHSVCYLNITAISSGFHGELWMYADFFFFFFICDYFVLYQNYKF